MADSLDRVHKNSEKRAQTAHDLDWEIVNLELSLPRYCKSAPTLFVSNAYAYYFPCSP